MNTKKGVVNNTVGAGGTWSPKKIAALGVLVVLLVFSLASCGATQSTQADQNAGTATEGSTEVAGSELEAALYGMDFEYTDRDQKVSYDQADAVEIVLSDSGSSATSESVGVEDSVVTITAEGTYVVSGSLSNGYLCIDAPEDQKVQIVLSGATIHNETGPAMLVEEADKVFVTLAEGTANALSDGGSHETAADDNDHDGTVFSHSDITFNGTGSLTVKGNYANGIVSKDDLVITGGTYDITAVGDGVQGKDCVKILDGAFNITSGGDGVKSNNDEDETRGFVSIDGGIFTIVAGNDGIQAETVLRMFGGEFAVTTAGGATGNIASSDNGFGDMPGGQRMPADSGTSEDNTESTKAFKAGQLIEIRDAKMVVSSLDDAIHSNGSVSVLSGDLTLTTDDDAFHAENILNVEGGTINVVNSYEGLEGGKVYIKGGDISVVSADDGVNAASDSISDYELIISGGSLYIVASGDALDSNGDLTVTGGTTNVYSINAGIETALDTEGTLYVNGGTVIAGGSAGGMAMTFSGDSEQPSFMYQAASAITAGTIVSLTDSSGSVLMTFEVRQTSPSLVVSSPELKVGETYTLYTGATLGSSAQNGIESGGQVGNAQQLVQFTLSENSVLVSSSGQVSAATNTSGSAVMGGGMGGGRPDGQNGTPPDRGESSRDGNMPERGSGRG